MPTLLHTIQRIDGRWLSTWADPRPDDPDRTIDGVTRVDPRKVSPWAVLLIPSEIGTHSPTSSGT